MKEKTEIILWVIGTIVVYAILMTVFITLKEKYPLNYIPPIIGLFVVILFGYGVIRYGPAIR